ncbi:MAG: class IV adenylate cyclase [Thermoanaerobaculales bacterium]|jgi:adenylate cyclase class 2
MLETEIKIPVASLAAVRQRLIVSRATRLLEATLEDNWVLDDSGGSLRRAGRLLRLRCCGGTTLLTFKEPGEFKGGVKSRPEFETAVESAEGILAILAALGFSPVRRYQKRRETWSFAGLQVCLDETPIGSFIEVEGEAAALGPAAQRLGLDPADAVALTYLDLWRAFRSRHPNAPEDMVFT